MTSVDGILRSASALRAPPARRAPPSTAARSRGTRRRARRSAPSCARLPARRASGRSRGARSAPSSGFGRVGDPDPEPPDALPDGAVEMIDPTVRARCPTANPNGAAAASTALRGRRSVSRIALIAHDPPFRAYPARFVAEQVRRLERRGRVVHLHRLEGHRLRRRGSHPRRPASDAQAGDAEMAVAVAPGTAARQRRIRQGFDSHAGDAARAVVVPVTV